MSLHLLSFQEELQAFNQFERTIQSIEESKRLLIASLSSYSDYCTISMQLLVLCLSFYPSLFSQLPDLLALFNSSFPSIPSIIHHEKKLSPSIPLKSTFKEQLLHILESTYLFVDSLQDDELMDEKNERAINEQLASIPSLLASMKKKENEKRENQEIEKPYSSYKTEAGEEEEENVCFVYQAVTQERQRDGLNNLDSNQIQQSTEISQPRGYLHELKTVLSIKQSEYKTVVVGDEFLPDTNHIENDKSSLKPPSLQRQFFSFLSSRCNENDIIE